MPEQSASSRALTSRTAWVALVGSIVLLIVGSVVYFLVAPVDFVPLQVAGSTAKATKVVGNRVADFRSAIYWDLLLLIPAYTIALAAACWLGSKVFWTRLLNRAARAGVVLALAAGLFNVGQDVSLLIALRAPARAADWLYRVAQGLSFAKFSALLVAGVVALDAWSTVLGRLSLQRAVRRSFEPLTKDDGGNPVFVPGPPPERPNPIELSLSETGNGPSTGPTHWQQDLRVPPDRPPAQIGVSVSGGGVRSATVTLGALQSLRECGQLGRARYLVSVSGGGYMAGAFQLALTHAGGGGRPTLARPADALAPGSSEEDHVRRHSSYLSDGPREWLTALSVLFRNLMASFFVIALAVATVGVAVAMFYRVTHIAALGDLKPLFLNPDRLKLFPIDHGSTAAGCLSMTPPTCRLGPLPPGFPVPATGFSPSSSRRAW